MRSEHPSPRLSSGLWLALLWCSASVQAASQCTAAFAYPVQEPCLSWSASHEWQRPDHQRHHGHQLPLPWQNHPAGRQLQQRWPGTTAPGFPVATSAASWPARSRMWHLSATPTSFLPTREAFRPMAERISLATAPSRLPPVTTRVPHGGGNSCVATLKSSQTYRFDTLSISRGEAQPQRRDRLCQEADHQR